MTMSRIFLPNPLQVRLAPSDEHPGGKLVEMPVGWNEIPDELKTHPLILGALPKSPGAEARLEKLYQAETAYSQAVQDAADKLNAARQALADEERAELTKLTEEHNAKAEAAAQKGVEFNETHPDPEVQRAISLTGGQLHVASAEEMMTKLQNISDPVPVAGTVSPRPKLPEPEEVEEEEQHTRGRRK